MPADEPAPDASDPPPADSDLVLPTDPPELDPPAHVFDDDVEIRPADATADPDGNVKDCDTGDDSNGRGEDSARPTSAPSPATAAKVDPTANSDRDEDTHEQESATADDDLYTKLANNPSSVAGLVTEWMSLVQVNGPLAVADVLSLVVRMARPAASPPLDLITSSMVMRNDPAAAVADVAHVLSSDVPGPVPAVAKDPASRRLRHAYEDFWRRVAAESTQVVLFDTDCFDTLISWLEGMAAATSRTLRVAACTAAYRLVDGFIDYGVKLRKRLVSVQKQLATEKKKCEVSTDQARVNGRGKGSSRSAAFKALSQKGKDLAKMVDDCTANNADLVDLSDKVFREIFILKYRDVSPEIRALSLTALGSWTISYPDQFLDDVHNKYIGWLLFDKDAVVRRSSLEVLSRMLRKKDFYPSLEMLLQNFCGRVVQMSRDKDDAVAVEAIRLATVLAHYDLLDQESCDAICNIALEEPQTEIRRAAGEFMASLISAEEGASEEKPSTQKHSSRSRKLLSRKQKKSSKDFVNPSLAEIPPLHRSCESIKDLLFTATRREGAVGSPHLAVDAVWDHMPALRCWDAFIAILSDDRTASGNSYAQPSNDSLSKAPESQLEQEENLTDEDKAILCEVLLASVREASGNGDVIRRSIVARGERNSVDTPGVHLSRKFLPELPSLLVQFQADTKALAALVQLPTHFDMKCFEQEGQEKNFKDIIMKLIDIMSRHTGSPELVQACASTFKYLLSDENPLKKLTFTSLQLGCSSAAKELSLQVRADLSKSEPLTVAAAALRVRIMSELIEPNPSVHASIVKLLEYQLKKTSFSELSDGVTTDAARTGCSLILWSLSRIRSRLESSDESDTTGEDLSLDDIEEFREKGAVIIDLLTQTCSSVSLPIFVRMVSLQALLTSLTLCRGIEKFAALSGFPKPLGTEGAKPGCLETNGLDLLRSRARIDKLTEAVRSCVLAIIEHELHIVDHGLSRETSPRARKKPVVLSESDVRDCFASLVQSSYQSVLSGRISELPVLGLLLKRKKATLSESMSSEVTSFQLCRKYCQQRQIRETLRVREEVKALQDAADLQTSPEDKYPLIRELAEIIISARAPGQSNEKSAKMLVEELIQMVLAAHAEGRDVPTSLGVLAASGFALVTCLTAGDAAVLSEKIQEVVSLVSKDDLVKGCSEASLFATFGKSLKAVSLRETPEIPKLVRTRTKAKVRGGSRISKKRKRTAKERGAYYASPPVDTSNVRRSGRDRKKIDYAVLVGMSKGGKDEEDESSEESGSDDDDSQEVRALAASGKPRTAAEMARNLMTFSSSPSIPAARRVSPGPEELPTFRNRLPEEGTSKSGERADAHQSSPSNEKDNTASGVRRSARVRRANVPRPSSKPIRAKRNRATHYAGADQSLGVRVESSVHLPDEPGASSAGKDNSRDPTARLEPDQAVLPASSNSRESTRESGSSRPPALNGVKTSEDTGRSSFAGEKDTASPVSTDKGDAGPQEPKNTDTGGDSPGREKSPVISLQSPLPVQPPKPSRRSKRGMCSRSFTQDDKENVEDLQREPSPVKQSAVSLPIIRRKRQRRW